MKFTQKFRFFVLSSHSAERQLVHSAAELPAQAILLQPLRDTAHAARAATQRAPLGTGKPTQQRRQTTDHLNRSECRQTTNLGSSVSPEGGDIKCLSEPVTRGHVLGQPGERILTAERNWWANKVAAPILKPGFVSGALLALSQPPQLASPSSEALIRSSMY